MLSFLSPIRIVDLFDWGIGLLVLGAWFGALVGTLWCRRYLPVLADPAPGTERDLPPLTVIVPARDEEADVEAAMRSLLGQDYPRLQIVAVDDRSTDRTGAILDRLASEDPRLEVLHVHSLPPGWLGKTNAMHEGSQRAEGRYILFTDADVHFEPAALKRAVHFMETRECDHLVATGEFVNHNLAERIVATFFTLIFMLYIRPWSIANPRSSAHIGVGYFNLVRTETYRRLGGHRPIRLDVLDDIKLGKLMKRGGGRQRLANAHGMIRLHWIQGFFGIAALLEKNAFASVDYNPIRAILASSLFALMGLWPVTGPWIGPPGARLIALAALLAMIAACAATRPDPRSRILEGLGLVAAGPLVGWIYLRTAFRTQRRGGVNWRGTFYPLEELKKNRF